MAKERGRGRPRNGFSSKPQSEEIEELNEQEGCDDKEEEPEKGVEFSGGEVPEELRVRRSVVARGVMKKKETHESCGNRTT